MADATPLEGFTERLAGLPGEQLRCYVAGEGRPLVLVHGLGGAATNFAELAPLLVRRHGVLAVDLPGHGASDALPAGSGIGDVAERVRRCAELEGYAPATVLGHSFGGAVALRLALASPEAVAALVLVAPAGISSSSRRARVGLTVLGTLRPSRIAARYRDRVAGSTELKRVVFGFLASDPESLSVEAVHGLLAGSELYRDRGVCSAALFAEDPRPELGALRCPVLILWGARDRFLPLEDGFEYARRLDASLRVFADTGHLPIAERPGECAALIGEFLDRVGQVEELPGKAETSAELGRERPDAERLGRVVPRRHEVNAELA
jgi:pimeloyl-ACP methyl ester carboxylesterase